MMGYARLCEHRLVRVGFAIAALFALGACAPTQSTIPFTIQSDPLGAYVLMQTQTEDGTPSDWVYLGNTPLTTNRTLITGGSHKSDTVTVRVMREGYFDQSKAWKAGSMPSEVKESGKLFWNPKLVRQ